MSGQARRFTTLAGALLAAACASGPDPGWLDLRRDPPARIAVLPDGGAAPPAALRDVAARAAGVLSELGWEVLDPEEAWSALESSELVRGDELLVRDPERLGVALDVPALLWVRVPVWDARIYGLSSRATVEVDARLVRVPGGASPWRGSARLVSRSNEVGGLADPILGVAVGSSLQGRAELAGRALRKALSSLPPGPAAGPEQAGTEPAGTEPAASEPDASEPDAGEPDS